MDGIKLDTLEKIEEVVPKLEAFLAGDEESIARELRELRDRST